MSRIIIVICAAKRRGIAVYRRITIVYIYSGAGSGYGRGFGPDFSGSVITGGRTLVITGRKHLAGCNQSGSIYGKANLKISLVGT